MDFILGLVGAAPLFDWMRELLHADVAKQTLAFLIAAGLHRRWVKKDMAEQFGLLRGTIDHVAEVMSSRIDGLDRRVESLEKKPD